MPAPFEVSNTLQSLIGKTAVKRPRQSSWHIDPAYSIRGVFPRCGVWFAILRSMQDDGVMYVSLSALRRGWKVI